MNMVDMILTGIGFVGVGMILLSYFLLQSGKVEATSLRYALLNIAGSSGVLLSLIAAFNWPSFVIQVSWIGITLFGMARRYGSTK